MPRWPHFPCLFWGVLQYLYILRLSLKLGPSCFPESGMRKPQQIKQGFEVDARWGMRSSQVLL